MHTDIDPSRRTPEESDPSQSSSPQSAFEPYFDIDFLFSNKHAARIQVSSSDKALKSTEIPACFKSLNEAQVIWEMILSPSKDPAQIFSRQACVREFAGRSDLSQAIEDKNCSYSLENAIYSLCNEISYGPKGYQSATVIDIIQNPTNYPFETVRQVEQRFSGIMLQIKQAKEASHAIYAWLEGSAGPTAQMFAKSLEPYNQFLAELTEADIRATNFWPITAGALAAKHSETLRNAAIFMEVAHLAKQTESYCYPSCDSTQALQYKAGHNILCPKSLDYRNDSPEDLPCVMFGSVNKSGKSETGLKQSFSIQLLFQSFGITSAVSANLPIYLSFHYLDRPTSDAVNELSSYTYEKSEQAHMYNNWVCPSAVWMDEPDSTTSPGEQHLNTIAQINIMVEFDAKLYITTHNVKTLELAERNPDISLNHFPVNFSDPGNPVYSYLLTKGYQDSESFRVIRADGFNLEILERAERHLQNGEAEIYSRAEITWPSVAPYTEEQRQRLKLEVVSSSEIFAEAPMETRVFAYYGSRTAEVDSIAIYNKSLSAYGFKHNRWKFEPEIDSKFLHQALFMTATPTPQESYERSQLLSDLEDPKIFDALLSARRWLEYLRFGLVGFRHAWDCLDSVNKTLNPYANWSSRPIEPELSIKLSLHYLELMNALAGEGFLFIKELLRARELKELHDGCREYILSHKIGELYEGFEAYARQVVSPRIRELFAESLVAIGRGALVTNQVVCNQDIADLVRSGDNEFYKTKWRPLQRIADCVNAKFDLQDLEIKYSSLTTSYRLSGSEEVIFADLTLAEFKKAYDSPGEIDTRYAPGNILWDLEKSYPLYPITDQILLEKQQILGVKHNGPFTLRALEKPVRELKEFIKSEVAPILAPISAFNGRLDQLREHVLPICQHIFETAQLEYPQHPDRWPVEASLAVGLYACFKDDGVIEELVSALRSKESIYCHQIANSLEAAVSRMWGAPEYLEGKFLEDITAGDPNNIPYYKYRNLLQAIGRLPQEALGYIQEKPSDVSELIADINFRRLSSLFYCASLAHQKRNSENASSKAYAEFLAEYAKFKYDFPKKIAGYDDRRYFYLRAEDSSDSDAKTNRKRDLKAKGVVLMEAFREAQYGIHRKLDPDKFDLKELVQDLADSAERGSGRGSKFDPFSIHYCANNRVVNLLSNVNHLLSLACLAQEMNRAGNWCNVVFNAEGRLDVRGLRAPFGFHNYHPQDILFSDQASFIALQSAHGSGKTFFANALVDNIVLALSIGRARADSFSLPPLGGVLSIQRVAAKHTDNDSGLTSDLANWKPVLERVALSRQPLFVSIDEPWTTIPLKYKEPLVHTLLAHIYEQGHYGIVADHVHEMLNKLEQIYPGFVQKHFAYKIESDGSITFSRDICDGPAQSFALEVLIQYLPAWTHRYFHEARGI